MLLDTSSFSHFNNGGNLALINEFQHSVFSLRSYYSSFPLGSMSFLLELGDDIQVTIIFS